MDDGPAVTIVMTTWAFWIALSTIAYAYVGYPLIIQFLSRFREPHLPIAPKDWPSVSIIVCAHNESHTIRAKLQNLAELQYPPAKRQVVVVSDGSNDDTVPVARAFAGVDVLSYERQQGKPTALNLAAEAATGEILVFTDARQLLSKRSIEYLVIALADPGIGVVSGLLVQDRNIHEEKAATGGLYWKYEKSIRLAESRFDSIPGATGALYAIRRDDFVPITPSIILDDVELPMNIVRTGLRSIMEPRALAHDFVSDSGAEMARKIRTLTGNFQLVACHPWLMSPRRNPIFFQFFSHKIVRLLVPYMLIVVAITPFFLNGVYRLMIPAQALFYLLALVGMLSERLRSRMWPVNVAFLLIALNIAALRAFGRFVGARYTVKWKTS